MGIFSRGPKPVERDQGGRIPLHYAAVDKEPDQVCKLLAAGQDPNDRDFNGSTPLHLAAQKDNVEVLRLLLDAGADVNAVNDQGRTPLFIAASSPWSTPDTVGLLLEHGADPYIKERSGINAIEFVRMIDDEQWRKDLFAHLPDDGSGA
ncbi:ankyrin repeat domain-containing protein [Nocardia wallacei]|uniref:ankyrin repeat domain-containing protein n=1 Tax=Nocardia wallacei TaxID=480035 RepID=UPI002454AACF|nr:ankyrin repeat domain-containing protein [Nocardia wallacei]